MEILALQRNHCYVQKTSTPRARIYRPQVQSSVGADNSPFDGDGKMDPGERKVIASEFLEKCAELKTLSSSLPATAAVITWIESAIRRDPEKSHKVAFALLETCVQSQPTLRLRALECVSTAIEVAGRGCGDAIPKAAIDVSVSLFEDEKIRSLENYEEFITAALDECVEVWAAEPHRSISRERFLSEFSSSRSRRTVEHSPCACCLASTPVALKRVFAKHRRVFRGSASEEKRV